MNQEQKNKLIKLVSELRDAAMVYGGIATEVQGGAYIKELVIKARQRDVDESMQAILDYLKTI